MSSSKCHRTSSFDVGNLRNGWRSCISSSVGNALSIILPLISFIRHCGDVHRCCEECRRSSCMSISVRIGRSRSLSRHDLLHITVVSKEATSHSIGRVLVVFSLGRSIWRHSCLCYQSDDFDVVGAMAMDLHCNDSNVSTIERE